MATCFMMLPLLSCYSAGQEWVGNALFMSLKSSVAERPAFDYMRIRIVPGMIFSRVLS